MRICLWVLLFIYHVKSSISIQQINDGQKVEYTFATKSPFKFKLVKTFNSFSLFFNKKFNINLSKLQNSIVRVTQESGKFSTLTFLPRIENEKYYAHQEQLSNNILKLTFSKQKPKPEPYSSMQDVKNMLLGQAYIIIKFSRDTMKWRLNSPIRKDICTFKRGDYTYIAIETDHEIRFNLPAQKYVSYSNTILKNGLQLIILKTELFHKTTKTDEGWLIEFSKTPDAANADIDPKFIEKSHNDNNLNPRNYPDLRAIINENKNVLKTQSFLANNSNKLTFTLNESAFFFKVKDPIFKDEIIIIPLYNPLRNRNHITTAYFDMIKTNQGIAVKLNDDSVSASYNNTDFILKRDEPFFFAANTTINSRFNLLPISDFANTVPWLHEYKSLRKELLQDTYDIALFKFNKFMTKHLLTKESQQNFYHMIKHLKCPNLKTQIFLNMGINAFLNLDFEEAIYFLENQQLCKNETLSLLIKMSYALNNPNIVKFSIQNLSKFINQIKTFGKTLEKQILLTMLKFNKKIDPESFSVILNELCQFELSDDEKNLFLLNRARSFFEQKLFSQTIEDLKLVNTTNQLIFSDASLLRNQALLKIGKISENAFIKNLETLKVCNSYIQKAVDEELLKTYISKKMFLKAILLLRKDPSKSQEIQRIINEHEDYFSALSLTDTMRFLTLFDQYISRRCKKSIGMFFLENKFLLKAFNIFREVILRYKQKEDIIEMIKCIGPFLVDGEIIDFLKDNHEYIGISKPELLLYFARIYYLQKNYLKVIDTLKHFNLKTSKESFLFVAESYFLLGEYQKSEIIFLKMFEVFRNQLSQQDILKIILSMVHNKHNYAAYKLYLTMKPKLSIKYENMIRNILHLTKDQ